MGYLLGRGDVFVGDRDPVTGALLAGKRIHCPVFELEVSAEFAEHKNSTGPVRVRDARIAVEQMAKLAMTLDTKDAQVFAMACGGAVTSDAGTSFSAKAFPTGLQVGQTIPVPGGFSNLQTLTLVDSTGSPTTLVLGTHYTVDLINGLITIISLASLTQPLKASGQSATGNIISIATQTTVEKFIRFNGIDIGNNNAPILVEVYRAQIPPTKIAVKGDGNDFTKYEFAPELLADPNAPFSGAYGQYGRIVTV